MAKTPGTPGIIIGDTLYAGSISTSDDSGIVLAAGRVSLAR